MSKKQKTQFDETMHFYVPFLSDYGFKVTFADKSDTTFCRHALSYLADLPPIQTIQYIRNEFESVVVDGRSGVYDVICEDEHKQIFLLEMQVDNYEKLLERLQFYAYQLYISTIEKGRHGFNKIPPIYCICIMKDAIIKSPQYHHRVSLRSDDGLEICNNIIFHLIELGKFPIKKGDFAAIRTPKEKLLYTMKYLHISNPEKNQEIPRFWTEEWLENAIKKLDVSKMSPRQKALYEIGMARQMSIIDHFQKEKEDALNAMRAESDREKAQLLQEVKEKEARLLENMEKQQKEGILKALKSSKLSVEEIAEYFNVSLSYVIALKKEMI